MARPLSSPPPSPAHLPGNYGPNPSLSRTARTGEATEDELLLERPKLPHPAPRMPARAEFTRGDPWRGLGILGGYFHGFDPPAEGRTGIAAFRPAPTPAKDSL